MAYNGALLDYFSGGPIEGPLKLWTYRTSDAPATILAANYISDVTSATTGGLPTGNKRGMTLGDIVIVSINATTMMLCIVNSIGASGTTLVTAPTSTIIDLSGGTAAALTGVSANLAARNFVFYTALADLADAQLLYAVPAFGGKVTAASFMVKTAATTAAKLSTLSASINGSGGFGGAVALTSANCTPSGATILGTAVTATAWTVGAASIGFVVSGTTAFVEGSGYANLGVVNSELANTIATLIKFS